MLIAPGWFLDYPEKFQLTVDLTRIMFPFLFFISIAALAKGILNSLKSFFVPALAPMFLNVSIITAALFFVDNFAVPIMAIAVAVTVGGAIQVIIQLPALLKKKFIVPPVFSFKHPGLKKIRRLLLPAMVGMGAQQINVLVGAVFVSFLAAGSVTYLYFGLRFVHLPIGIFGVSMATAVLPTLSEQAAKKDLRAMRETFSFSLRLLFFLSLPAMAGLITLSEPIIQVLLQRGEFTPHEASETAYAVICYSTGLWAFVGYRVVVSVFYSLQDTKTPMKIAMISILVNIVFCFILMKPMRHGGLALATAIAQSANFLILFYLLKKRFGHLDGKRIVQSFIVSSVASVIMALTGIFALKAMMWNEGAATLLKAGTLAGVIALCIAVYILIMYLLKSDELQYFIKKRRKRIS